MKGNDNPGSQGGKDMTELETFSISWIKS